MKLKEMLLLREMMDLIEKQEKIIKELYKRNDSLEFQLSRRPKKRISKDRESSKISISNKQYVSNGVSISVNTYA